MMFRRNMAYRAPANQDYFGMRYSELKEAAAAGDEGAAAEIERRAANAADPTTKAGQRRQRWAEMKQQQESAPKKTRAAKVEKAAAEGKLNDNDYVAAASGGVSDKTLQILQRAGQTPNKFDLDAERKLLQARRSLATLHRAGRMSGNPISDAKIAQLKRIGDRDANRAPGQPTYDQFSAEIKRRMAERKRYLEMGDDETLKILQTAGRARKNPLPYPGARVLYPQQGIVQGGTGPFYGPTGTLFDRTPDMLWAYANPRRGSRKNPEILWPKSARKAGVIQGGTSEIYGPDGVPFNNYPDLTEQLLLNGKRRRRNPRMSGADVLWPKSAAAVGPIQGGADIYMSYPSAAPFDRMPNLTRTLKNKKRSR